MKALTPKSALDMKCFLVWKHFLSGDVFSSWEVFSFLGNVSHLGNVSQMVSFSQFGRISQRGAVFVGKCFLGTKCFPVEKRLNCWEVWSIREEFSTLDMFPAWEAFLVGRVSQLGFLPRLEAFSKFETSCVDDKMGKFFPEP